MSNKASLWVALVASVIVGTLAVIALPAQPATPPPPPTAESPANGTAEVPTKRDATVTVDADAEVGPLNNPAEYQNQSGPSQLLGPADERRIAQLAPTVVRGWFKPESYYDHVTETYNFNYASSGGSSRFYTYADQLRRLSKRIFANFDQCDPELMTPDHPDECRTVLKNGIRHYKLRYPSLRYIELFNEPDKTWEPAVFERPAMNVEDYYTWYKIGYSVVNEINAELDPAVRLHIGGPAAYTFESEFTEQFLDLYRADPDPAKRLDFLSYHQYRNGAHPAAVATEKETARRWLSERGLNPDTPTFVTEYGVFPGTNTGTTFEEDLLAHAAAMSTLGYYYLQGGTDMVMHWVWDHGENDRKSMLVDGADGQVYPYYNVVAMQRKLKSRRLAAISDSLDDNGMGVNVVASRDRSGVAVLATNYQWIDGTSTYDVHLTINDLPHEYRNGNILVERYLVDATTSNYAFDPALSDLQRVERYELPPQASLTTSFQLDRNAVSLIVLTPF
ncbi:hypothetical protein GCM10009609_71440 [Pseudonocardia aurantiaca]|uniref:Glycosyl hydrolase family 39 n=1 Tax=Pseudonocardia aurantiaca TaxID=75290 RepID=A0ABW4FXF7_9PSEU